MKVRICEKCQYYQRKVWSHLYEPSNYHTIGMSHAYGFCQKYKKRCLSVKKCEIFNNNNN